MVYLDTFVYNNNQLILCLVRETSKTYGLGKP